MKVEEVRRESEEGRPNTAEMAAYIVGMPDRICLCGSCPKQDVCALSGISS